MTLQIMSHTASECNSVPAGMPALPGSVQATPHWERGRPGSPMGVHFH